MRLLVSVANAEDATAALAGGADIIDAKDPSSGALGAVTATVLREICGAVGNARPVTAALGDASDTSAIERSARDFASSGTAFVKIGFAGVATASRIADLIAAAVHGARSGASKAGVVAVAYADTGITFEHLVAAAAPSGAEGVLIDTADKNGPGLRQLVTPQTLARRGQAHGRRPALRARVRRGHRGRPRRSVRTWAHRPRRGRARPPAAHRIGMKSVCVFAGSNSGSRSEYGAAARDLGRALVRRRIDLVYGGARIGLMGTLADAVLAGQGRVTGVIPEALVAKEVAHAGLSDLRIVASMHERKALMADLSDGFIALPGGWGTLEELFEVLTWGQLGLHRKPCGLLNVGGFFDGLLSFLDHSVDERFVRPENRAMVLVADAPDALLDLLDGYVPPVVSKWIDSASI